jgi:hypothetical protein
VSDETSFKWATVTNLEPLAIRLDGDSAQLAMIPDSLVDPRSLRENDRVRVELSKRKCIIHGKSKGLGTSPVLIRPSQVFGGEGAQINDDGTITPGSGTSIRIDGVFSQEYMAYRIMVYISASSGMGGCVLELARQGVVLTGSGAYTWGGIGINNSTTVTGYHDNNASNLRIAPGNANQINSEILLMHPCSSIGRRAIATVETFGLNGSTQAFKYSGGGGTQANITDYDGFRINPGVTMGIGKIAVYGLPGYAL